MAKKSTSKTPSAPAVARAAPLFGTWRPIATAPKNGTPILVLRNEVISHVKWGYGFHKTWKAIGHLEFVDYPSHWMPPPPLPNAKVSQSETKPQDLIP